MSKRTYCATCAYFRDNGAMGLGCCEIHRHVVFGGTPACDDAWRPTDRVAVEDHQDNPLQIVTGWSRQ